jgi:signal transduction histidine kinase
MCSRAFAAILWLPVVTGPGGSVDTTRSHTLRIATASAGIAMLALVSVLALAGVVPVWAVGTVVFLFGVLGLVVGFFKLASGPLSRLLSRTRISIRWKVGLILSTIIALVVFVSVVNFQAMDYMHTEVHEIQELGQTEPFSVRGAVDDLERTSHGPIFDLAPFIALLGGILAVGLGVGMARSVLNAIRSMEQGMGRIAAGDFSQPIRLENRDELGALADRINRTADELATAHEATVLAERAQALQERITQVSLAQEEERRRISRELHDDLGPSLAAIVNRLRAAEPLVAAEPERVQAELSEVAQRLTGHIQGIRELIYDLRPLTLDQLGLVGSLRQYVERFGQEHAIEASFTSAGEFDLNPLVEVTVLRVAQECLSNVQRHAGAARVEVALAALDGEIQVCVADDGRGFDAATVHAGGSGKSVGLLSMRERAELVDGNVVVKSHPGGGCQVTLRIPLKEALLGTHSHAAR